MYIQTQHINQFLHQHRIVNGRTQAHGNYVSNGLNSHLFFEHPWPIVDIPFFFQRIVCDGLISPAGSRFSRSAQNAIDQKNRKEQTGVSQGDKTQQCDFNHHQYTRHN